VCRAIEAQDIAWHYIWHPEGEADGVARGDEVRPAMNVGSNVPGRLCAEEREELLDALCKGGGGCDDFGGGSAR